MLALQVTLLQGAGSYSTSINYTGIDLDKRFQWYFDTGYCRYPCYVYYNGGCIDTGYWKFP
jgi:hypothetical protein